ncbi:MAG TPA: hypothetical protein VE685_04050 [Thermoanaerobaculia bacterium]|nr:hypothetical protein [Thermoanaerobaculia bacterium]
MGPPHGLEPYAGGAVLPHHQVRRPEEGGDELRFRAQVQLVGRPHLQEPAEAQDPEPVR